MSRKGEMKTRRRSPELLDAVNKLHQAQVIMEEVCEIWQKLKDEEFFGLGVGYPSYLPSFDEFLADFDFWIDVDAKRDDQV